MSTTAPGPGIVSIEIADKAALHAAYMPFITNGGLFIPKASQGRDLGLGDEVFLLLQLVEQRERLPIAGKVVWVTPEEAQGQRPAGVGIQFSGRDGGAAQQKIEALLGGSIHSERATHTL